MTLRSSIRHTCFRMKNGRAPSPGNEHIVKTVEAAMPSWANWGNFSDEWDVFITTRGQIKIVKPENDYEYAHAVCLEAAIYARKEMPWDFDDRAMNVLLTVELNMLGNMQWAEYGKTWGIYIDPELRCIRTKHFLTRANIVTPEMIQKSIKSDGAAMTSVPALPSTSLSEFSLADMTPEERAIIEKFSKKAALN